MTTGQNGPGRNGNKGVLYIPQSSNINGTSSSNRLVSYPGYSLEELYPSAEMQSAYSAAPADWATGHSLEESYPSARMQSVYSAAPADWVTCNLGML